VQFEPVSDPCSTGDDAGAVGRTFLQWLQRLDIRCVLDIGSGQGLFARQLRRAGFTGTIYSVEPAQLAYRHLLGNASADPQWLPLARQGAGAAPQFRPLGAERVFVQAADRLLRTESLQSVEALRIAAPAIGQGALDGYQSCLSSLRVVLVELPDPEAVESNGVAAGDARQRLKAAGMIPVTIDATEREVARHILYVRSDASPRAQASALRLDAVVTSVGGRIERRLTDGQDIGPLWLRGCAQSWQRLGAPVFSVAERAPPAELSQIRWAQTATRPSITQMLSETAPAPGGSILLTNADIVLCEDWLPLLGHLRSDAVYYGSRLEVERDLTAGGAMVSRGVFELGFDFFVLPHAFVATLVSEKLLPEELRIGEPWWDYLLPILALARGFPLKKLSHPTLALHYVHPARYTQELWLHNRERFMRIAGRLLRESGCHATALLTELLANPQRLADVVCRALP
jgi:SAM-dependent methyltransferase